MNLKILTLITIYLQTQQTTAIRLTRLFEALNGINIDPNVRGLLHVGSQHAIFLRLPSAHDKNLFYELYEVHYDNNKLLQQPVLMAVSIVPVEYIKEQLKTFREELLKAKYEDSNVVPGTRVLTLREWQLDRALLRSDLQNLKAQPEMLRMISEDQYKKKK